MLTPAPTNMFQKFQFSFLVKVIHELCCVKCLHLLCKHWIFYLSLDVSFNSLRKSCSDIRHFNQQLILVEHAGKFETKFADNSKTPLKLWEISSSEIAKVGAISTKQKKVSPFKTNWTDRGRCKV